MRALPLLVRAPTLPYTGPPLDATPATADRVTAAFHAAFDETDRAAHDELRASTFAFVTTLKSDGALPERVLVSLKSALTREGRWVSLAPVCCQNHGPATREHLIYGRVFGWYLDAYYGTQRFPHRPAPQG